LLTDTPSTTQDAVMLDAVYAGEAIHNHNQQGDHA
jgi:hypothetical protein